MADYVDTLSYWVIVEHRPERRVVVTRRTIGDWVRGGHSLAEVLRRLHEQRGNRVDALIGKFGEEKLYQFIEDGVIYHIDDAGMPAV